jgi:hypothetical protein
MECAGRAGVRVLRDAPLRDVSMPLYCTAQAAERGVRSDDVAGEGSSDTSDMSPQSPGQTQLTPPSWHPGEDLTPLEEEGLAAARELVGGLLGRRGELGRVRVIATVPVYGDGDVVAAG